MLRCIRSIRTFQMLGNSRRFKRIVICKIFNLLHCYGRNCQTICYRITHSLHLDMGLLLIPIYKKILPVYMPGACLRRTIFSREGIAGRQGNARKLSNSLTQKVVEHILPPKKDYAIARRSGSKAPLGLCKKRYVDTLAAGGHPDIFLKSP